MSNRPRVFLDINKDGKELGRIVMELWTDIAPKTCENFRCLCTGEKGKASFGPVELTFKGAQFHRLITNFMVQCKGCINPATNEPCSIWGDGFFEDETFAGPAGKVDKEGLLCMANRGPNTNRSGTFITTKAPLPHLDGKHVVFGEVVQGYNDVVKMIEACGSPTGAPSANITVANCGQL